MRVGGMFDGAGLLALGLHQAGLRHAWLCEADEWRRGMLERRFGVPVYADVRDVGAATAVRVDVIAGGFPCKGASNAGKREGFGHPETVLWREMARAVRELRPRYVVVENVAAILGLHDGAVWGEVLGDLATCGYDVEWDVFPAAAVGAPHRRERVFAIAAHADGAGRPSGRQPEHPEHGRPGNVAHEVADVPADTPTARLGGRGLPRLPAERGAVAAANAARIEAADPRGDSREGGGPRRDAAVSSGQAAPDPGGERRQQVPRGAHGDEGPDARRRADNDHEPSGAGESGVPTAVEWGEYGPAIRRWEAVHGPAPEPLIRRLDDGDAAVRRLRARVDRSRLSALGDGVHVYLGRLIGQRLIELEAGRMTAHSTAFNEERER